MIKEPILKIKELRAYYVTDASDVGRSVHAVDDVSLTVYKKEIFGIAGESGCGKTTLLKVLFGLMKPPLALFGGDVLYRVNGEDKSLFSIDEGEMRRLRWNFASYIPQGSMSVLNPTMRIKKQFLNVLKTHQKTIDKDEMEQIVVEHVKTLGLPAEVLPSYPHQLSGGMRQRIVVALATVLEPRIIFLDEPTTALDVVVQRGVIQMLGEVQRKLNNTLLLVTHDMGVHAEITDRIGIMYAGKIVEVASVKDIFKEPLHPYTQFLISSLPKIGFKSRKVSISGSPPSLIDPPLGCRFHPRCPYSKKICSESEPLLEEFNPGHFVACFLRKGI